MPSSVGPRLRISMDLNNSCASCHSACLSLLCLTTDICALVIPLVMGNCSRGTSLTAMSIEPFGATVRLAVYASHSASVKIRLNSLARSTMVAMLAARFWRLTFHVKYINSGSCSRDTPISPAVKLRLIWRTLVVEDMVSGVE